MNPFVPDDLPLNNLDYAGLIGLVGRANAELARYDGLLQAIVNPAVMLSPLTTQEAVLSSKIEGTQATLDEVLEHEAGDTKSGAIREDIREIVNYRTALALAHEAVVEQPIGLPFIRQLHRVLLDSVRGEDKSPGEFRKDQNWIGRPGSTIAEASYVPPSPIVMQQHLDAWVDYLRGDDFDVLAQLAVVHAQFELIHPFKDGNGRIGRLLIPLFLFQKGVLSGPSFYLSGFLEANRDEYYRRLGEISRAGDWDGWIRFFLGAIVHQAKENAARVRLMLQLYDAMKERVAEVTRSQHAIRALDALFARPILQTSDFVDLSGIPKQSAMPMLRQLRSAGVLEVVREASGRRAAILCFPSLLDIVEGSPPAV